MKNVRIWAVGVAVLSSILFSGMEMAAGQSATQKVRVGKQPGDVKGRWLEIYDQEKIAAYDAVVMGEVKTRISWKNPDKQTPVDEELLKDRIRKEVLGNLKEAGYFKEVLDNLPAGGEARLLKLDCDLLVEPGNRGTRYLIGMGAGKSKSIMEIFLRDKATGTDLGLYHGYGTGSGMAFKLAGGGARKMTEDDIQENAKEFAELLRQFIK